MADVAWILTVLFTAIFGLALAAMWLASRRPAEELASQRPVAGGRPSRFTAKARG